MPNCSFCNSSNTNKKIVQNNTEDSFICSNCAKQALGILDSVEKEKKTEVSNKTPSNMLEHMNNYIIGQEKAKKSLSIAVYNHYKRLEINSKNPDTTIRKSNILLIGPTGTGKTLLAQTLAKSLDVPFTMADATTLTEAGYVGEDVEQIISKLLMAADGDVAKAEKGIIYIDEIDKIARKSENRSITRDVSGEGVQQSLLKLIEGTVCSVPEVGERKNSQSKTVQVNTKDILFICGGAFEGLDKVIASREDESSIGFSASIDKNKDESLQNYLEKLEPHDLMTYGMVPEFIGRLPIIATLNALSIEDLKNIIKEPKDSILKEYELLFKHHEVDLNIEDAVLSDIAKIAIERKTGARGLRSLFENILSNAMFDLPDICDKTQQISITLKDVENQSYSVE